MARYQSILIAVDLGPETDTVARRGRDVAKALGAHLRLIHVIPPQPLVAPIPPEPVVPIIVRTLESAREQMMKLSSELGVPESHWQVVVGEVRGEIVRAARAAEADLVVIGSHERHGRSLFAHFTVEDKLLHHAPCDVLAVRVSD